MKSVAIIQKIRWWKFPEWEPKEHGFYLVALKNGTVDTAPWNPAAREFQHGARKSITHYADALKHPAPCQNPNPSL